MTEPPAQQDPEPPSGSFEPDCDAAESISAGGSGRPGGMTETPAQDRAGGMGRPNIKVARLEQAKMQHTPTDGEDLIGSLDYTITQMQAERKRK